MWLYLRDKGFRLIPYFLHWVPGLSYVEKALDYYENFFQCEIIRLPHPLFYNMVRTHAFATPESVGAVRALGLQEIDYADCDDVIAGSLHLIDPPPFCAIGMRSADNMERRRLIQQQGPIGIKRRRYLYAIWDWTVDQVADIIVRNNCLLPADYKYWGRTISAFHYQYLAPLRQYFPSDYERIRQWFPLIEAEFFRYEAMKYHEPEQKAGDSAAEDSTE